MVKVLIRWIATSIAIWVAVQVVPGFGIVPGVDKVATYLLIAVILGLVNATLGGLVRIFTLPLTVISLGLWLVAINAIMLLVTAKLSYAFFIDSFWWAVVGSVVIGVISELIVRIATPKPQTA